MLAIPVVILGLTNVSYGQFAQAALNDGAFVYWTMNESSPGATQSLGSVPVGGNFPADNNVEFGAPGLADPNFTAVKFNGFDADAGVGGLFNINNSGDINAGGPWTQKTIELWFSVDDADSSTEQVIYEQGGSTRAAVVYVRDGKVFAGVHNSATDGGGAASPWPNGNIADGASELAFVSTNIDSDTPYHLALVMDGADAFDENLELPGTLTGYLNGQQFESIDGIGTLYSHTDAIRVGGVASQTHFDPDFSGFTAFGNDGLDLDPPAASAQAPYFFQGVVDDLALYDSALTAEQIQAHYDARDYVAGDFDGNGSVGFEDFMILSANFNLPGSYSQGDISFNGRINIQDFSMFRRVYGAANAGGGAASVPEPSPSPTCHDGSIGFANATSLTHPLELASGRILCIINTQNVGPLPSRVSSSWLREHGDNALTSLSIATLARSKQYLR